MFKLLVVLCLGAFVHGIASFRLKNVNYSFGAEWGKATVDFDGLRLCLSDASAVDGLVLQINFQHHPYKGIYYEYNESCKLNDCTVLIYFIHSGIDSNVYPVC